MTADSTVAEIEASGGTALGVEVDVRDHEAVEAVVARVVQEEVASMSWSRMRRRSWSAHGHEGQHPRSGAVAACCGDEPFRDLLTRSPRSMKQQRSGKIITVSSVAGTGPSADGGYAHYGAAKAAIAHYTRYLAQDLGPFGITRELYRPRRDSNRADHADGDSGE
jgi:3-oxoacyl-[acyl-carrier protein] reductase